MILSEIYKQDNKPNSIKFKKGETLHRYIKTLDLTHKNYKINFYKVKKILYNNKLLMNKVKIINKINLNGSNIKI